MIAFKVGDRVSNKRTFAEEHKYYGVVTEVLRDKVVVVWNHNGVRRIVTNRQIVNLEYPENLILESQRVEG